MNNKLLPSLLFAVYFFSLTDLTLAQSTQSEPTPAQKQQAVEASSATGCIAGTLKDPSGAVIAGGRVELRSSVSGFRKTILADPQGHFVFEALPAGHYQLVVIAPGFAAGVIRDLSIHPGSVEAANLTLKVASAKAYVEVDDQSAGSAAGTSRKVDAIEQGDRRNAAEIMAEAPGVGLRANGQLASIPMLHGLGDERT
jgi:hypothetical protein